LIVENFDNGEARQAGKVVSAIGRRSIVASGGHERADKENTRRWTTVTVVSMRA
jgi:hypothetical protein